MPEKTMGKAASDFRRLLFKAVLKAVF